MQLFPFPTVRLAPDDMARTVEATLVVAVLAKPRPYIIRTRATTRVGPTNACELTPTTLRLRLGSGPNSDLPRPSVASQKFVTLRAGRWLVQQCRRRRGCAAWDSPREVVECLHLASRSTTNLWDGTLEADGGTLLAVIRGRAVTAVLHAVDELGTAEDPFRFHDADGVASAGEVLGDGLRETGL